MTVGILALHGDFAEHAAILKKMHIASREVRTVDDLKTIDHLIIPGGESTTMALLLTQKNDDVRHDDPVTLSTSCFDCAQHDRLSTSSAEARTMKHANLSSFVRAQDDKLNSSPNITLKESIRERNLTGTLPIFGTCAGAILLAKEVIGKNAPESLGLIDITIERNGYGTQIHSFHADIMMMNGKTIPVSFIRAPKITRVGKNVEVLAQHEGIPVLVRERDMIASTFHTEVTDETLIHQIFLKQHALYSGT